MGTTTKRQLSFYAESDVDLYLSYMTAGSKTAILNEAIRGRMRIEAMVDLNNGQPAINFGVLSEDDQSEVLSNMVLRELSLNDVDAHIWEIVRETASRNWKDNTRRYLTLHQAKFKEPFRIKRLRSQEEKEESIRTKPILRTSYYCDDHKPRNADVLTTGEMKCAKCGAEAVFSDHSEYN